MPERFYITTPIYYPNGEPHLGHIYTTLCADTIARYHRLKGDDVRFLTGTDEHGIKMVKTAADEKTTPQALADKNASIFRETFKEFSISNDDFIRTTESRHKLAVQEIVRRLEAAGDIYLGSYEGWYDEGQEEFITETEAKDADYKSKISKRPLVRYKEPTYFFKLTKYVDAVFKAIESDQIQVRPISRKNEVLSKLKGWNQDLSISRASLKWGIEMPNDPNHVLYVWIDALSNYITALDWPVKEKSELIRYWPADVHLIGKEILWFHAFYWPAMLMALGQKLPKTLFAHGWWTSNGDKMSKTMGNFVGIEKLRDLSKKFGQDSLRFYMLKAAPFGNDLDWTDTEFLASYGEIGNVLGNLLNRALNMLAKYRGSAVPGIATPGPEDSALRVAIDQFPRQLEEAYAKLELQRAALLPIDLARAANTYIDQTRPFTLAKDPNQSGRLDTVLHNIIDAVRVALVGLIPILPIKAIDGLKQLNIDSTGKTLPELLRPVPSNHRTGNASVLFPKVEEAQL